MDACAASGALDHCDQGVCQSRVGVVHGAGGGAAGSVCAVAERLSACAAVFGLEGAGRESSGVGAFFEGEEILRVIAVLLIVCVRAAPDRYDVVRRACWRGT